MAWKKQYLFQMILKHYFKLSLKATGAAYRIQDILEKETIRSLEMNYKLFTKLCILWHTGLSLQTVPSVIK